MKGAKLVAVAIVGAGLLWVLMSKTAKAAAVLPVRREQVTPGTITPGDIFTGPQEWDT